MGTINHHTSKIKVGIIAGYMDFFDSVMPDNFRQERSDWAKHLTNFLGDDFDIIFSGLIVSREDGVQAGRVFIQENIDVVLVIPTMAAPPAYAWEAVKQLESMPLIVWTAHEMKTVPADYTMIDLVRHSSNVGTIMFTNLALRNGRQPLLIVGVYNEPEVQEKVRRHLKVGATVARLKRSNIGIIGSPIDGYDNVLAEETDIKKRFGLGMKHISVEQFTETYCAINEFEIEDKKEWLRHQCLVEEIVEEEFDRSIKLALTLENLTLKYNLAGGAFNCRGAYGVSNPEIGVIGCLGVSYMTTKGHPFTCTGDIVTAIAMIITKQLGSQILYCECDQIDYVDDYMLMANTGEADFCFSCEKPCLINSKGHSGQPTKGVSMFIRSHKSIATLVGLSPKANTKGGWVLIMAKGELLGTEHQELKVGNAMFRFENGPTHEAFARWCLAGATHHASLCLGDLVDDLKLVGELLGIETIIV